MNAFERISALLKSSTSQKDVKPLPEADAPHALGALLVRVALSDNQYAVQEISQIDKILSAMNDIGPIEAAKLRAECERLEHFAPDTPEFAFLLCANVSYEDRLKMVQALWQVVFADGTLRDVEGHVMEVTQSHLGIRESDCTAARLDAQRATGLLS